MMDFGNKIEVSTQQPGYMVGKKYVTINSVNMSPQVTVKTFTKNHKHVHGRYYLK